ncbi:type III-B CRISPR module RAMP protein Cmr4 [Candidatus Leptofilum sp.]|uniref:type III-B CRISPR module RAMP protein Cmr4 n=1 Tax=Candidatus Leptofilum sp. TaxID=3241576 RepID=UPI003B5BEC32
MEANMMFIHALTPLHAGTGQGIGVIDLPIAKETATGLPYLPGSSLKGVLRDRCQDNEIQSRLFGPAVEKIANSELRAGEAQFSDQRLLLLPVRSLAGTFAWVTSPFILQRLKRELTAIGMDCPQEIPMPTSEQAHVHEKENQLTIPLKEGHRRLVLEDIDLTSKPSKEVSLWATWIGATLFDADWQKTLNQKICVVHDDILSFLLETATVVIARNQLTEDKTSNNLWYEEALPAESILSGLILTHQISANGRNASSALAEVTKLTKNLVQLGGNATIGRGLCRLVMAEPGG